MFGALRRSRTFAILVAAVVVYLFIFSSLWTNEVRRSLRTEQDIFINQVPEPRMCIRKASSWNGSASALSESIFTCMMREKCDGCECYDPRRDLDVDASKIDAGVLEDASNLRPNDHSIFFADTSCPLTHEIYGNGVVSRIQLPSRQACAVEAAARLHPRRTVYLLVAAPHPIPRNTTLWSRSARALLKYSNVQIAHLTMKRYVKGSPLEEAFVAGALARGPWPTAHASLMVMFLTLWRFGGTFFDSHFVLTRPIDDLYNFAIMENPEFIGSEVLSLSCDALGRRVAAACARELHETFNCYHWHLNGPGVITRVLRRMCRAEQRWSIGMKRDDCQGFQVLPAFFLNQESPPTRPEHVLNRKIGAKIISKIPTIFRSMKNPQKRRSHKTVGRRFCPHVLATERRKF